MGREIDLEELEARMQSFEWSKVFYDPMDLFNIDHEEDRGVFARLESIMHDVNTLCNSSKETEDIAIRLCEKYWTGQPMEQQIPERRAIHMDMKIAANTLEDKFKSINWKEVQDPADNRRVMSLIRVTEAVALISPDDAQFMRSLTQKYFQGTAMERFIIKAAPQHKTSMMNEENFEFLQNSIKFLGFGEKLGEELRQKMQSGETEFSLQFKTGYENKDFEASLQFKKSATGDHYFLNGYDAKLKNDVETLSHHFRLTKGKGVTMKEAYNLLDGRAVYKELKNREGQDYKAWIKLDLQSEKKDNRFAIKQYHDNYGFDLGVVLKKYPQIKETLSHDSLQKLVQSLKKGNEQAVGLVQGDETKTVKIFADPENRTIALTDDSFTKLEQTMKVSVKQSAEDDSPVQRQRQRISHSESISGEQKQSPKQKNNRAQKPKMNS